MARVWAGAVIIILALGVASASALPVQPDIKKLLTHPAPPKPAFPTARAGWDGPEMPPPPSVSPHATLESLIGEAHLREMKAVAFDVVTPDPRSLACIVAAILIGRRLRHRALPRPMPHAFPRPAPAEQKELLAA